MNNVSRTCLQHNGTDASDWVADLTTPNIGVNRYLLKKQSGQILMHVQPTTQYLLLLMPYLSTYKRTFRSMFFTIDVLAGVI